MEARRARRRRLTLTIAERRERLWIAMENRWGRRGAYRSWNREKGLWVWSKLRPLSCGCSKKHLGAPRRDRGMCKGEGRRRIYRWRQQVRELQRVVLTRKYDLDDDLVATLSSPQSWTNSGLWQN